MVPIRVSTFPEMLNGQGTSSSGNSNLLLHTNHNNNESFSLLQKRTAAQHIGNNLTLIRRDSSSESFSSDRRYSNIAYQRKRYRQNEAMECDPWKKLENSAKLDHGQVSLRETYFRNRYMIVDHLNLPQFLICSILYKSNNDQLCLDYFTDSCLSRGMNSRYFKLLKFEEWFHSKKSYMDCGKNIKKRYKNQPEKLEDVVDYIGKYRYFPLNEKGITMHSTIGEIQEAVKTEISHDIVKWIINHRKEYFKAQIATKDACSRVFQ